jgi:hypothetical protein
MRDSISVANLICQDLIANTNAKVAEKQVLKKIPAYCSQNILSFHQCVH